MMVIEGERYKLHQGDNRDVLKMYEDDTFDSIVTDSPYGLRFMGADWDRGVPGEAYWREMLRVAKPGAHLLAFGGTRTSHRLACAIEDAGWEIRDTIMWVYGSGFPKSLDVSKAIDKAAGAARGVMGNRVRLGDKKPYGDKPHYRAISTSGMSGEDTITTPATDAARQWDGWGTALKPAWEPIIVARKPLEGTVAAGVMKWGTGAINIDGCRVGTEKEVPWGKPSDSRGHAGLSGLNKSSMNSDGRNPNVGRWPANLVHDGSEEVVGLFPQANGGAFPEGGKRTRPKTDTVYGEFGGNETSARRMGDTGSAARFFYCAKASKEDRDEGLDGFGHEQSRTTYDKSVRDGHGNDSGYARRNHHPTVKPTALMRWLVRLVTPPGGVVLDPFMGSGSTGKAALLEGFLFAGIELDADYLQIAHRRINAAEAAVRNAAGDLTPTASERASGQRSLLDLEMRI